MTIDEALKTLNKKFVYTADRNLLRDKWTIIKDFSKPQVYGDCEDYSLTLVWLVSDGNMKKFWRNLRKNYSLYFVKSPGGEGHIVLYDKTTRLYVDNIQKKFVTRDVLISKGYKLIFRAPNILIRIKLAL